MRVLIIGSLAGALGQAAMTAQDKGAQVSHVENVGAALICLRGRVSHDLVICDVSCGIAGLVCALATERVGIAVVASSDCATPEIAGKAIREGAREFLPLPADPDLIAGILLAASGQPHAPVVRDPAMLAVMRRAEQVARSRRVRFDYWRVRNRKRSGCATHTSRLQTSGRPICGPELCSYPGAAPGE